MIDELGLQSSEDGWGFKSVFFFFFGEDREEFPLDLADSGDGVNTPLSLLIELPPNKSVEFEFISEGVFLPSDRYVWYSQDFCENCKISRECLWEEWKKVNTNINEKLNIFNKPALFHSKLESHNYLLNIQFNMHRSVHR
jgi:hypothetical protein